MLKFKYQFFILIIMPTEEQQKFIATMLKKVEEKQEAKPQSRTEGVDRSKIENFAAILCNGKKKK